MPNRVCGYLLSIKRRQISGCLRGPEGLRVLVWLVVGIVENLRRIILHGFVVAFRGVDIDVILRFGVLVLAINICIMIFLHLHHIYWMHLLVARRAVINIVCLIILIIDLILIILMIHIISLVLGVVEIVRLIILIIFIGTILIICIVFIIVYDIVHLAFDVVDRTHL